MDKENSMNVSQEITVDDNLTSWGEKKVELDWLIQKYNGFKSEEAKKAFLDKTIKTIQYTNFEVVCGYVDIIVAQCMFDNNGDIKIDSCKKYLQYVYALIAFYTNINVHGNGWTREFNLICRNHLLEEIINRIPKTEISTLDAVLEMKTEDALTNYYNIQNWVSKKIGEFYPYISKGINDLLEGLGESLNNLDEDKITKILKQINN